MMLTNAQRRKAFRAALLLADYHSIEDWAKERGYASNHVHLVLRGERVSGRVQMQIDTFAVNEIMKFVTVQLRAVVREAA